MKPPRASSRWLASSASAGVSRSVGRKKREARKEFSCLLRRTGWRQPNNRNGVRHVQVQRMVLKRNYLGLQAPRLIISIYGGAAHRCAERDRRRHIGRAELLVRRLASVLIADLVPEKQVEIAIALLQQQVMDELRLFKHSRRYEVHGELELAR